MNLNLFYSVLLKTAFLLLIFVRQLRLTSKLLVKSSKEKLIFKKDNDDRDLLLK